MLTLARWSVRHRLAVAAVWVAVLVAALGASRVMVVVFASFIGRGRRLIEMFGLALASAVFLDALVIRVLLLPATLQLLGERTWWFPPSLDRHLPRFALEPPEEAPAEEPEAPVLEPVGS